MVHFSGDKMKMKLNEVGWDVGLGPLDLQSNEALRGNDYVLVNVTSYTVVAVFLRCVEYFDK